MTIFTDLTPDVPRRRGAGWLGWSILGVALVGVTVVALLPAPYVIEQPGPVFNVLGDTTIGGKKVSMIQIPSKETFPTSGSLDMLTVNLAGDRSNLPNWLSVAIATLDPSRAVVPVDEIFPPGVTVQQSNEQSRVDMQNSQKDAIAAALTHLDYPVAGTLVIAQTEPGSPADGVFMAGDTIISVNGTKFTDVTALRKAINANGVETAAEVVVDRDGSSVDLTITPTLSGGDTPSPILGVVVSSEYKFPFDVKIQLDNVGGPSAGMMFALGIIDKLTAGSLNGGQSVAGTGTITGTGEVGPIGGIRQKMWGAQRADAKWFLAPASNCDEVTGHIPSGLTVFAVKTLDDSIAALKTLELGGDTSTLPTCPKS